MWQNSFKNELQKLAARPHGNASVITEESTAPLFHDQDADVPYDPNRDLKNSLTPKHQQVPPSQSKKPKTLNELFNQSNIK